MSRGSRPAWFRPLSRTLIACGLVLLFCGVAVYGRNAMTGTGSMLLVFFLLMSSLGFFNATTVIAKRLDRTATQKKGEDSV
ncbi:hypothetical protein [Acanthopleuribacter pedis]|uniref:Transmembrane protein n=1 Tax=Acanthopleuribacter pedis TaxID=442870 RepID=A0A8J7QH03_9BACT|nr:hypothetical protein [Acanthopleuribacter pedis]MBO1320186.1 hypothetical protein [Acanthopleuribacter pedis]